MIRITLATALLAAAFTVNAQTAASAPSSPAKKELVSKVLKLQQPGVEAVARQLVQQPAAQMLQAAANALQQRVAADRRQAVGADMQADARKYAEEMTPVAIEKATKLAPTTLGPMLEEAFTEDELKQLIAILESPVNRKYQSMGVEMQKTLGQKLFNEMKPTLEPRLKKLQQGMAARMAPSASGASTGSK